MHTDINIYFNLCLMLQVKQCINLVILIFQLPELYPLQSDRYPPLRALHQQSVFSILPQCPSVCVPCEVRFLGHTVENSFFWITICCSFLLFLLCFFSNTMLCQSEWLSRQICISNIKNCSFSMILLYRYTVQFITLHNMNFKSWDKNGLQSCYLELRH